MSIGITISVGGSDNPEQCAPRTRTEKGKSLIAFPENFTVIDLETTGLEPQYDDIIEVSALRVRGGIVVDTFSSLVRPEDEISDFITNLTGITNEMLAAAPSPEEIFPSVRDFIGDDVVVGHNVNFDVNFLYDGFEKILNVPFSNSFVDTMRISRKVLPDLKHHRLTDISDYFKITQRGSHRALNDCQTTFDCFCALRDLISSTCGVDAFVSSFAPKKYDLHDISAQNTDFDETHPLFGKHCVFTGTLQRMTRAEAAQIVVNVGGLCDNGVNKNTNFLILGNNDYCTTIKGGKSTKQKKAEEYKLSGIDIEIIPESVFYDMIEQ